MSRMSLSRNGPDVYLPLDSITQTFGILAMRDEAAWAWAAGIFEGEGCISYAPARSCRRFTINMTDLDVLESFAFVVGAGSIVERKVAGHRKRCWGWSVGNWPDVERIGKRLLPYLRSRRRQKMATLLGDRPIRGSGLCRKGLHRIHGEGADVYVNSTSGNYACGPCTRKREREKKATARTK